MNDRIRLVETSLTVTLRIDAQKHGGERAHPILHE